MSTGITEMIRGSKINDYVDGIWGCEFIEKPIRSNLDIRIDEENEEDYVLACPDLWNTGDKVSLIIPADKIKLTLKPAAGEKK